MKKFTTEEFKNQVFELVGEEYTVLGNYINTGSKIDMRHNKCGYEYMVRPESFKRGSRCPKCFRKFKKTTEEFKVEVFNLVGKEYTVLGNYINTDTKIKIKHNKCGYEYMVKPDSFKRGRRCPKCFRKFKKNNGRV